MSKETVMDGFDAGREMQEQVRKHKLDKQNDSGLEKLLNEQTMSEPAAPVSRSEEKYPGTYKGGNEEHWNEQDMQKQYDAIRNQAVAQEKVGYEEDTQKFFMDDPDNQYRESLGPEEHKRVFGTTERAQSLESLNGPPLVFGGFLLGASLTVMGLAYFGLLEVADTAKLYIFGGIAAAVGLMYAAQLRN